MATLSNFPWLRGLRRPDPGSAVEFRPARPEEVEPAIRIMLDAAPLGDDAQVREFIKIASQRSRELGGVWIATHAGHILSSALPITSPGKTMLVFAPSPARDTAGDEYSRLLINAICQRAATLGLHLAQCLLDAADLPNLSLLQSCGFARLAELIYLQVAPRNAPDDAPPPGYQWVNYATDRHAAFSSLVLATYENSLDCPALNGLRDIEDILAGHKATGDFNPKHWFMLKCDGTPAGALLLSRIPRTDATELVYLGLAPAFRGRGLANVLMRKAVAIASSVRNGRLSLAVDAANQPALKLYWRFGMQAVARKTAMIRDLRKG